MKALVTGASSGIGYEISKYLSKKGYDIIAVARSKESLENLKKELKVYKNEPSNLNLVLNRLIKILYFMVF